MASGADLGKGIVNTSAHLLVHSSIQGRPGMLQRRLCCLKILVLHQASRGSQAVQ